MVDEPADNSKSKIDRREFMGRLAGKAAGAASLTIIAPNLVRGTAANSSITFGLLGCGGRGTADATFMIGTGQARLVALGDLFQDQLDKARAHFDRLQRPKGIPAIERSQMFVGPNSFEEISSAKGVDAIVIATPPYFHVQHLDAVVTAGKHVYCEKPVAVDPWGVKRVNEIGQRAQGKVSLDIGFQIRSCPPFVELVRRIRAGQLGKIACGEAHYLSTYIARPAWPGASPAARRIRNWIYDRILSGDIIVEQNIHAIDVCNWTLQAHPLKVQATGGRRVRPPDGNVYGHYNVVFYYPENVAVTFTSTQFDKGWWDVTERFFGSKGVSQSPYSGPLGIWGDEPWRPKPSQSRPAHESTKFSATGTFSDNLALADPEKKKQFVESLTSGNFHNQAAQGAESALTCIMARTAAYEGREVTWDEMSRSNEKWDDGIDLNKLS